MTGKILSSCLDPLLLSSEMVWPWLRGRQSRRDLSNGHLCRSQQQSPQGEQPSQERSFSIVRLPFQSSDRYLRGGGRERTSPALNEDATALVLVLLLRYNHASGELSSAGRHESDEIGFSRAIGTLPPTTKHTQAETWRGPLTPPLLQVSPLSRCLDFWPVTIWTAVEVSATATPLA